MVVAKPFICSFHIAHSIFTSVLCFHLGLVQPSTSNLLMCECEHRLDASSIVMPVHGLIHDGQSRACPCVLLGLMYGLRRLYVIRYLGFQFVSRFIKGQTLPLFL